MRVGEGQGRSFATGGMRTKLEAARTLQGHGIDMVITNGQNPESLYEILGGRQVGTRFTFASKQAQ